MPLLETIVVPVDFSETSRGAFRFACRLARVSASRIELLHVLSVPLRHPWIVEGRGLDVAAMEKEWTAKARETMERWIAESDGQAGPVDVVLRSGHPAQEILKYAEDRRASLVVMGAHGESAVARFFLGSVAERVVRHSTVPVLTVPPGGVGLHRIVVPTDFSETARDALRLAAAIAREAYSEIHVVHVIPDPLQVPSMVGDAGIAYYHQMEESWKAQARAQIQQLVAAEGIPDEKVITAVFIGHPARTIVAYAEEQGADVIVMGAHGHSPVTRFLLGSVADRVVRQSPLPVLTVPHGSLAGDGTEPVEAARRVSENAAPPAK